MLRFFEVFKVIFLKVFSARFRSGQTINVDASERSQQNGLEIDSEVLSAYATANG